ncbi:hypothetical protein [Glutamicibacter sp.]|uniref:hypothetical protein n=1 Tax=Glutamicibacter sp. TaxID=1931995 RepID=UPI0028BF0FA4|nr:hypothetical protein [Glutamicibacter sp.]
MATSTLNPCDLPFFLTRSENSGAERGELPGIWALRRQVSALRQLQRNCGCEFTDGAPLRPHERQSIILGGGFAPAAR